MSENVSVEIYVFQYVTIVVQYMKMAIIWIFVNI